MDNDQSVDEQYRRLSDRITFALELAVTQGKQDIAQHLMKALNIELREHAPQDRPDPREEQHIKAQQMESALEKLNTLDNKDE
jgi:hypothetical protein